MPPGRAARQAAAAQPGPHRGGDALRNQAQSREALSNDEHRSSLLRTRLRVPRGPAHFVRRQRLDDLLDDLVTAPLTLVVAPAGAGKTQLLAGWIAESRANHAWLSLDEGDWDGVQLWSGIIAAL